MGLCASSNLSPEEQRALKLEKAKAAKIDAEMRKQHQVDSAIHKLLLLGAGESGKSTLFKQMIKIYGKGFDAAERATFVHIIHGNVVSSIKQLCDMNQAFLERGDDNHRLHPEIEPIRGFLAGPEFKAESKLDPEVAMRIEVVWKSDGIQRTYARRNEFQLNDSTKYFLDDVMRVSEEKYLPTEQDVLRSRVRTTGIVEQPFIIDGNQFKMFDVGGQRNERKKWIHCFEDVTAVLFVAALSEYDMRLFEDEDVNRMVEAVQLFEEISNSRFFTKTSIILFLNKRDLLAEKIGQSPLNICPLFADYDGPNEFEPVSRRIQDEFESKIKGRNRQCYTHITCATDTNNCKHVFNAVKDIVIRRSLQEGGLMTDM